MKRFLLSAALLLACSGVALAQESEFSGGGGGGITTAGGSGTAGVIPAFVSASSLEDSKMTTSGGSKGTWTLYDSTAVTGVSTIAVRAGAGQSTTALLEARNNADTIVSSISAGGLFLAPAGAVGAPGHSFLADPNTGLYSVGADNPGMSAGGVLIQSWSTTTTTVNGALTARDVTVYDDTATTGKTQLLVRSGEAQTDGTYMLGFYSNANSALGGFRDYGNGKLYFEAHDIRDPAASVFLISENNPVGITLNSSYQYFFGRNSSYGNIDTGIASPDVGYIKITNGSTGDGALQAGLSVEGTQLRALADNTITNVVLIASATENSAVGGHVDYTIVASDATNELVQSVHGSLPFLLINENGVVTVTLGTVGSVASDAAGGAALTATWASSVSGTDATLRLTADYDQTVLTGTVTQGIYYRVYIDKGVTAKTPQ